MQKICKVCGCSKPLAEYSKQVTNKDGYNNTCKLCVAEYGRKHRELNIEKERRRANDYYQHNKAARQEYNNSRKGLKVEYAFRICIYFSIIFC